MVARQHEDGFRRVNLSSSDSGHELTDTEPCGEALPMEIDEMSYGSVPCGGCFPANTPITSPAIGLTHKQFCEKIMGEPLPGMGRDGNALTPFPHL